MEELVNDLQFDAAALLIEIQDVSGVTQNVVNKVVSRVNQLFESFLGILHQKFESKCGPHEALSQNEIFDVLNSFCGQNLFEGLDTRKKLDDYLDQMLGLIGPEKVVLLSKKVTNKNSVKLKPIEWGYYIPFLPSLEKVLSCPEVLQCVKNPLPHTPGVYKTALDGAFYRNHPIVEEDPQTLGVGIYTDGAEVTDSASSKSGIHSLNFIYWSLYNIHPDRRSSIRSVFLLGVVKVSFLKKHGYDKILADFINGMNQLYSTGVVFNINGVPEKFRGLFITCSGDNPGSANIGRFKESSSFSNKPCRQCYVTQRDLYSSFKESTFKLRSKDSHLAEVVEVETGGAASDEDMQHPSVRYGVNGRSALMDIHGCDITKCLPQDCMHDILEGTLKLDICCILDHVLIQKKSMSVGELNNRIRMFSKSVGVNKPAAISLKHVQKFKLKLTASEALNLAYILPFVLRKKKFISGKTESVCDEKNLQLLILRLNLMDLLLTEEISTADRVQIQRLTELHHALFDKLYPDRKIPKMHYELHFSTHILLYGPPRQYWCFRYEAKHAFFKRRWRLYRTLKDHAGTLAWAHQRNQCGLMLLSQKGKGGPFLPTSDYCGRRSVFRPLQSLRRKNEIKGAFPKLSSDAAVPEFNVASVKGVVYHRGSALITAFNNKGPMFGKLVNIFKVQEKLVFVFQKFQTISYEKDLNSFRVRHTREFSVILANSLPYNHRLILIQTAGICYITVPCRSYLNV